MTSFKGTMQILLGNINNRLRVQTKTQGISYKKVNGTEAFGFSNKQIVALLEGLPNVMDANGYVFQDRRIFEGIEEEKSSTKGNAKTTSKTTQTQIDKRFLRKSHCQIYH